MNELLKKFLVEKEVEDIFLTSKNIIVPTSKKQLYEMCFGDEKADVFDVSYIVEDRGRIKEAEVVRCKNGASVNFVEDYMRRRDPNSMLIADKLPTDKPTYKSMFGCEFDAIRQESFDWLKNQELIVLPFMAGGKEFGYPSLLIAPKNAAFFCMALADLQGFVDASSIKEPVSPRSIIFLVPPFRHTYFKGKQYVVHNRRPKVHECFAYNLYPGPSAKKGVYAVLLDIGESEGWLTAHASTVKAVSPYKNEIVIMHEGASGGGKSEMLQDFHREPDGRITIATNSVTGEKVIFELADSCDLMPVTDDMALCHPKMQNSSKKLVVRDAESGWFLRFDNVTQYGTDSYFERVCTHPKEPMVFMNLDGIPKATCLVWEHTLDSNGQPCPNPRSIISRSELPDVINGSVEVDVRSFGVRMPPCTKGSPTYGVMGLFHVLPPALAWLWRLVAPRGYKNPSIIGGGNGLTSEGVGSYWPFATGKKVKQANLLLRQIIDYPKTRYIIIPNQYVGAYKVGFMGEWTAREFIARRNGALFAKRYLLEARCPIMGYTVEQVKLEGNTVPNGLLRPETQPEIGIEGYDAGAKIITDFFKQEVSKFLGPDLDPIGKQIIELCLNDAPISEYLKVIPMKFQ